MGNDESFVKLLTNFKSPKTRGLLSITCDSPQIQQSCYKNNHRILKAHRFSFRSVQAYVVSIKMLSFEINELSRILSAATDTFRLFDYEKRK